MKGIKVKTEERKKKERQFSKDYVDHVLESPDWGYVYAVPEANDSINGVAGQVAPQHSEEDISNGLADMPAPNKAVLNMFADSKPTIGFDYDISGCKSIDEALKKIAHRMLDQAERLEKTEIGVDYGDGDGDKTVIVHPDPEDKVSELPPSEDDAGDEKESKPVDPEEMKASIPSVDDVLAAADGSAQRSKNKAAVAKGEKTKKEQKDAGDTKADEVGKETASSQKSTKAKPKKTRGVPAKRSSKGKGK